MCLVEEVYLKLLNKDEIKEITLNGAVYDFWIHYGLIEAKDIAT